MSEPEPIAAAGSRLRSGATLRDSSKVSNLAELTALFAANNGGNLSTDLALEIVLNEIVEQACLATGATGAAIVLERDGEMVCRATSGTTAPELGSRLDSESGISAECVRTHRAQRCDDAQSDPRVDVEASNRLGIRSVMVLPLLRDEELAGIFEVFSTRAYGFGERDQHTLETLAQRVIQNLESSALPPIITPDAPVSEEPPIVPGKTFSPMAEIPRESASASGHDLITKQSFYSVEIITRVLAVAVVACALLLGSLVVRRFGWAFTRAHPGTAASTNGRSAQDELRPGPSSRNTGSLGSASSAQAAVGGPASEKKGVVPDTVPPGVRNPVKPSTAPPDGSLQVFENGKEVFRMQSSQSNGRAVDEGANGGLQKASSVDSESIVEVASADGIVARRVEPSYPDQARQKRIEGTVVLHVHINRDGAVQDLRVLRGNSVLAQAAVDAVRQWKFKPRVINGAPVEMQTTVTLNFRLPQ